MFPLNPSPEVEGMLCLFQDGQEDEDRPVSQEKSHHKNRRKDSSQDRKDRRIRRGGQKQDNTRRPAENLQEDEKNEKDLKPRKKKEKEGKDERIERERKDPPWNPRCEKKSEEDHIKEEKP
jgi:hypothetical protein